MKKIVLLLSLSLLTTIGSAQVIFYVKAPSPNAGNYDITYGENSGASPWGMDLTNPLNAVTAPMMLIDDGKGKTNPIGCVPVINDLTGKIAVVYRGDCEFGKKALNAQNAGAVGVIIINNLDGEPVAMGAGEDGAGVIVPTIMISNTNGALLRAEIDAGLTEVFIGSKNGLYSNDLGMTAGDVLRASNFSNVQAVSQNAAEFEVPVGAWIRNYGSNAQTGVKLNFKIMLGGTELYNESSDPITIPSGTEVWVPLTTFSQASYANGYYKGTYSVTADAADEDAFDNKQTANFVVDAELFSLARLDEVTKIPVNSTNQFNGTTDDMYTCMFYKNANASRIGIKGINYSAGTSQNPEPSSLDGQAVDFYVYEWNDIWTDLDDVGFNIADLNTIAYKEYIYTADKQSENIFIALDEPIVLADNQKYLVCIQHYGDIIYPGYDTKLDYNTNVNEMRMPVAPVYISGQWYGLGFGTDKNPSMSVSMFSAAEVGLVELSQVDLTAYPNPANHIINIPVNKEGSINLQIVDMAGKVVSVQNLVANTQLLQVDVTSLSGGQYVFNLAFEDGQMGSINVMITK